MTAETMPTALIVGASRGLGAAIAVELAGRDWHVIGTVREGSTVAPSANAGIEIESLDMTDAGAIAALRERLAGRTIDLLFVSAGITTADPLAEVNAVSDAEFDSVMRTNALSPMRVIEALEDLVPPDGLIGVMTSGQGSITNNVQGTREVYRASKAALNMLMRSFAARPAQAERALLLLAPGWIRTALGGDKATYTLEESAPILADILIAKRGRPGLEYLDRFGATVPW